MIGWLRINDSTVNLKLEWTTHIFPPASAFQAMDREQYYLLLGLADNFLVSSKNLGTAELAEGLKDIFGAKYWEDVEARPFSDYFSDIQSYELALHDGNMLQCLHPHISALTGDFRRDYPTAYQDLLNLIPLAPNPSEDILFNNPDPYGHTALDEDEDKAPDEMGLVNLEAPALVAHLTPSSAAKPTTGTSTAHSTPAVPQQSKWTATSASWANNDGGW
ncbi:hypothetical protein C8R44DRAFT_740694 [Mycena epipterygia]|nr:hypothetical protein C8R44DRAFT_740694 [Mycena epipterygia]